ncbi:hypothetical protein PR048_005301 [Dryococelus australis]|uniref:PiggyBac transposable element-derived protein domain-containing protein n=1 Tax=Dryococelus australis TaxID=614101 RepID=A0ABQ9I8Y5_9NEOP|nr:hypothetical protein PR048_005301 [Dryococelus australis]
MLSLDELMMLWHGTLVFRQYIKNKRLKYGMKLFELTEPGGIVVKFCVYTGTFDDHGRKGHALQHRHGFDGRKIGPETVARYANNVMIGKWRDKQEVSFISTELNNDMVDYESRA